MDDEWMRPESNENRIGPKDPGETAFLIKFMEQSFSPHIEFKGQKKKHLPLLFSL